MDKRIILMITLVAALMLTLSGCRATWHAYLTEQEGITDWVFTDEHSRTEQGLTLEDYSCASPPFSWTGDLAITLEFYVNSNEDNWTHGSIWVGDGVNLQYGDAVGTFFNMGYGITDNWKVWTQKSPTEKETVEASSGQIPHMKNNDWNTWQFERCGSFFSMSMNGVTYAAWNEKYYVSDEAIITLCAENDGANKLIFRTIEVDYEEGCMSPI